MKKSIITDFSSGTPSSTFSVATGYSVGSEWVNTNNGNRFYHKTGGNWVQLDSSPFYIQGGTTYSLDTTSDIYRTGSLNIGTGIASPVLGIGGNFVTQSYRFVVSSLGGTVSLVVDDRGGVYNRSKGTSNTLFGLTSLYSNTTGFLNTAIGLDSLFSNTTGNYNVGVGGTSLYSNTNGQYNVAIGTQALYNNLSGDHNIALGRDSLISNTIGTNNQGIGYNTLFNSTGNYNIAIGSNALYSNTTGSYNIGIGQNIQLASGNNINSIVIGASASGNGSNSVTLGSDSITKTILKGNIGFGTTSPSTKLHIYGTQSGLFRLQDGTQGNGYILTSDANGVGSWTASVNTRNYKVYVALLSQNATSAPTAIVLENTLGVTVTYTYSITGEYIGTATGALTLNKTTFLIKNSNHSSPNYYTESIARISTDLFVIGSQINGVFANGILNQATIEIRVYN